MRLSPEPWIRKLKGHVLMAKHAVDPTVGALHLPFSAIRSKP